MMIGYKNDDRLQENYKELIKWWLLKNWKVMG